LSKPKNWSRPIIGSPSHAVTQGDNRRKPFRRPGCRSLAFPMTMRLRPASGLNPRDRSVSVRRHDAPIARRPGSVTGPRPAVLRAPTALAQATFCEFGREQRDSPSGGVSRPSAIDRRSASGRASRRGMPGGGRHRSPGDGQPLDVLGAANAPGIGGVTRDAKRCQVRRGGQVMIQQFPPQTFEPVDVGGRQVGNDIAHGGEPSLRASTRRIGRGDREGGQQSIRTISRCAVASPAAESRAARRRPTRTL